MSKLARDVVFANTTKWAPINHRGFVKPLRSQKCVFPFISHHSQQSPWQLQGKFGPQLIRWLEKHPQKSQLRNPCFTPRALSWLAKPTASRFIKTRGQLGFTFVISSLKGPTFNDVPSTMRRSQRPKSIIPPPTTQGLPPLFYLDKAGMTWVGTIN
jgi:hypothetical protein